MIWRRLLAWLRPSSSTSTSSTTATSSTTTATSSTTTATTTATKIDPALDAEARAAAADPALCAALLAVFVDDNAALFSRVRAAEVLPRAGAGAAVVDAIAGLWGRACTRESGAVVGIAVKALCHTQAPDRARLVGLAVAALAGARVDVSVLTPSPMGPDSLRDGLLLSQFDAIAQLGASGIRSDGAFAQLERLIGVDDAAFCGFVATYGDPRALPLVSRVLDAQHASRNVDAIDAGRRARGLARPGAPRRRRPRRTRERAAPHGPLTSTSMSRPAPEV
jgi:hypothetical protein